MNPHSRYEFLLVASFFLAFCAENRVPATNSEESENSIVDTVTSILRGVDALRELPSRAGTEDVRKHMESRGIRWNERTFSMLQRQGIKDIAPFEIDSGISINISLRGSLFHSASMSLVVSSSEAYGLYNRLLESMTDQLGTPALIEQTIGDRTGDPDLALSLELGTAEASWLLRNVPATLEVSLLPLSGERNRVSLHIAYDRSS